MDFKDSPQEPFHFIVCFTFNSNTTFLEVHPLSESGMCTAVATFTTRRSILGSDCMTEYVERA